MDVKKSKELAEKLSGEEVIFEAIEGIYLQPEEIEEVLHQYLIDQEEYLTYLNPIGEDKVVVHTLGDDEEVLVSFLMLEDGSIEKVYKEDK
jgi:hypothetical protein